MMATKTRVAVLFGGRSAEHEISVISGLQVIDAFDTFKFDILPVYLSPQGKWYAGEALRDRSIYSDPARLVETCRQVSLLPDPNVGGLITVDDTSSEVVGVDIYFLAFHGQQGEDGCIQGLLELAGAAYTGSGVCGSALAMHKGHTKALVKAAGIPVLADTLVHRESAAKDISAEVARIRTQPALERFPLFIKPCHLGSSIGIGKADDVEGLKIALANAFRYDDVALVEPCVQNLLEVNVSVIEGSPPRVSVVEIPIATDGVLSYEDKYLRGGSKTGGDEGMASLARVVDPQDLDRALVNKIQQWALRAYQLLECCGVVRIDFIVDTKNDSIYFNELNAIPGSFAYYLWEQSSPPLLFPDILERLIAGALERQARRYALHVDLQPRALT